jgi:hypothetical protein
MKNRGWSSTAADRLVIGHWSLRKHGFSLVELIFAVIMLTVIVFGVVKLQTGNLALTNTQKNELQAHFLANEGAEIVEAIGKGAFSSCSSYPCTLYISFSDPNYSLSTTPESLIDGLYERSVEIDQITSPSTAYKVTVLIQWTDSTGQHRRDIDTDGDGKMDNAQVEAKRIIF